MIGFFEYQYLKFKKDHLKTLVALAKADGKVDESELTFLYEIGHKYGLKDKQIKAVIDSDEKLSVNIPEKHHEKVGQLYDVVGMMMADNVIDDNEIEFCRDICDKMNLDHALIDEMVEVVKQGGIDDVEAWESFLEHSKQFSTTP